MLTVTARLIWSVIAEIVYRLKILIYNLRGFFAYFNYDENFIGLLLILWFKFMFQNWADQFIHYRSVNTHINLNFVTLIDCMKNRRKIIILIIFFFLGYFFGIKGFINDNHDLKILTELCKKKLNWFFS